MKLKSLIRSYESRCARNLVKTFRGVNSLIYVVVVKAELVIAIVLVSGIVAVTELA
jgi:hypothetical protein